MQQSCSALGGKCLAQKGIHFSHFVFCLQKPVDGAEATGPGTTNQDLLF